MNKILRWKCFGAGKRQQVSGQLSVVSHPSSVVRCRRAVGGCCGSTTRAPWGWAVIVAAMFLAEAGWGQDVLGEFKWEDLGEKLPRGATVGQVDGREALKIENTTDAPLQVNLLTIEKPNITTQVYQLSGEMRYDDVKGDGYLEMWNYFPPVKPGAPEEGSFSRTMAEAGPMGKISGTSGWRQFVLVFDRTGSAAAPTRLQVNLVLRGRGTVYIGLAKLEQLPKVKSAYSAVYPNAWWPGPMVGKLFGWGGAVIGCLGGLCGWLASRGKARGFVIAVLWMLTGLGAVCALGGLIGVAVGQPFFVWLPMLFMALLLLAICPVNLLAFRRRYEEMELRRMASMDARA